MATILIAKEHHCIYSSSSSNLFSFIDNICLSIHRQYAYLFIDYMLIYYPIAAREILRSMDKPDRDATVATRLIGAALGIKLKSSGSASKSHANSAASSSARKKTKSPPRVDAWG